MEKKSFEKISVSDITQHCNIHRQTFYYHFIDKYELLDWIINNEIIEPLVMDINLDNMYEHFEVMFETMKNDEAFFKNAFKINYDILASYIKRIAGNEFIDVIGKIEENSGVSLNDEKDKLVLAEFLAFGITGIVFNWSQKGMKESPQVITGRIKNIVNGMKELVNRESLEL